MVQRNYRLTDRLIMAVDGLLRADVTRAPVADTPSPGSSIDDSVLGAKANAESARLMRVNHTGEICAQALYLAQSALARAEATRHMLENAAQEERTHLQWCAQRLVELKAPPSRLNGLWFGGSYLLGLASAAAGDSVSLGFLEETENQVVAHLDEHLGKLPAADRKSRAILLQMRRDEARHASRATAMGARALPAPARGLMRLQALVMKTVASRI